MKMPDRWLGEAVQMTMTDSYHQTLAPIVLWGATRALAGATEPDHILTEMNTATKHTEWRVTWLSTTRIGFVSALRAREGWTAFTPDDHRPDSLTSWSRSLTDVHMTELCAVDCDDSKSHPGEGKRWSWTATARVIFQDGSSTSIPSFGAVRDDKHAAQVQEFLEALTQRMP